MTHKRWFLAGTLALLLAILLVAALPMTALAKGGIGDGRVIFGQNFVLGEGKELDGDLAVFGGNVTLQEGSVVKGDLVVAGGNLVVAGEVEGDVAVFGGNVVLRSSAIVNGDVVSLGGNIQREPGAKVKGDVAEGFSYRWDLPFRRWRVRPEGQEVPPVPPVPGTLVIKSGLSPLLAFALRILKIMGATLAIAVLSALVLFFWPEQTRLVGETALSKAALSFGMGLLTMVVVVAVAVILAVTVCLAPVAFLVLLALALAGLFGWIAIGWLVGQRILEALNVQFESPIVPGVVGGALITLVNGLLSIAPCCLGFLFWLLVASLGLGAVVLTRFGTQPYNGGSVPVSRPGPPVSSQSVVAPPVEVKETVWKEESDIDQAEEEPPGEEEQIVRGG
ncbi:MAG TPA: polymer-forming cytoskeletal protein [Anaerolineae bacterium]|nr:polymer-forming cytoskeletal protein [Anaerolineae bacterium]